MLPKPRRSLMASFPLCAMVVLYPRLSAAPWTAAARLTVHGIFDKNTGLESHSHLQGIFPIRTKSGSPAL